MSKNNESVNNKTNNEARKYNAAYGSNLSISQMALRCPDAEIIGTGKLMDYKLIFRYHADIEPHNGSCVPVLIWSITPADEVRLDRKRLLLSSRRTACGHGQRGEANSYGLCNE